MARTKDIQSLFEPSFRKLETDLAANEPNRISLCFQAGFQAIFKRGKPKSPTALQILKIPTKYFCLRFKNIIQKKVK